MKKFLLNSLLCLALVATLVSIPAKKTYAMQKMDDVDQTHVFGIPDGGWNVVRVGLSYIESFYSVNSTQNEFPFRQKIYTIKRTGAASSSIGLTVSNILHTDGNKETIISYFTQGDLMYDSTEWDWGALYFNNAVYYYRKDTDYTGQVTYLLSNPDGFPATALGSANIAFATQ